MSKIKSFFGKVKSFVNKSSDKLMMMAAFPASALTLDATSVSTDLPNWLTSITGALSDFSVANLITIIVAVLGITVGFAVFWFAYRFIIRKVSKAMKSGKV